VAQLEKVYAPFAEKRMNKALHSALRGKNVDSFEGDIKENRG